MTQLRNVAFAMLLSAGSASQVTPIEKVITLLDGMKSDVVKEAQAEAASYDKFACFCRDTTKKKSTSVTDGQDKIDTLSAAIADNTATKNADDTKALGLKGTKEALFKDLEENTARCATEKAEYETVAADLNKALSSLKSAIKSMADKKTAIGKVLLQTPALLEIKSGVRETLELADAMGLITLPTQKTMSAFLQQSVDPKDADYKYHSSDIVELLESLKVDFTKEKKSLDDEYGKTSASCAGLKKSLSDKIETNTKETKSVQAKISKLAATIADDRGKLVEAQSLMKDDEEYLKDLTNQCESRAVEWDQRSAMRGKEVEALSAALKVLGDKVKPADSVNSRAFVQQQEPTGKVAPAAVAKTTKVAEPKEQHSVAKLATAKSTKQAATSFLQRAEINSHSQDLSDQESQQEMLMKQRALATIRDEGRRLGSPVLTVLAMRVAADPFKKVKDLIQGLIERLITEAAGEATKKGFCDTEIGKAENQRTFRWTRVQQLASRIEVLQAAEDSLTEEIAELTKALTNLDKAVKESTTMRKTDKTDNEKTLETANNGLQALNEALLILRSFYKEAGKAAAFVQASPVDEDTAGAGFSGSYTGKQQSSNAVLALLETIASDFERTIRSTEADEKETAEAYVKFQQVSKMDIGGKTTKKELDEQDLKTTKNDLKVKRADMQNNMDLVDDAVKTLMDLKPTCIDTGMSYKERVSKREEEVVALKKALCLLDTNKVEAECK